MSIVLTLAALAAMVVAVAAHRRPLVCCPAAGAASGVLLVLGLELAVAGDQAVALAATTTGLVAGGWGLVWLFGVAGGAR